MSFFNSKEEVVNIELTPYGKYLISRGKFKPFYYEFYDDDVLYDGKYAGVEEGQEIPQQRIKESVRTRPFYTFEGADKRYKEYIKQIRERKNSLKDSLLLTLEKKNNFSMGSLPVANSKLASSKLPAWNFNIYKGKILNISSSVDVTGLPNNLYTLNLDDVRYSLRARYDETIQQNSELLGQNEIPVSNSPTTPKKLFEDNSYIEVIDNYLLLDVREENVEFLKENFDMYMYILEYDEKTGQEIEKPIPIDEYFFDIITDSDIEPQVLDPHLGETDKNKLAITDKFKWPKKRGRRAAPGQSPKDSSGDRGFDSNRTPGEGGSDKILPGLPSTSVLTTDSSDPEDFEDC